MDQSTINGSVDLLIDSMYDSWADCCKRRDLIHLGENSSKSSWSKFLQLSALMTCWSKINDNKPLNSQMKTKSRKYSSWIEIEHLLMCCKNCKICLLLCTWNAIILASCTLNGYNQNCLQAHVFMFGLRNTLLLFFCTISTIEIHMISYKCIHKPIK